MRDFIIEKNEFLKRGILSYFHYDYTTYGTENNPDFINILKNQFGNTNPLDLTKAQEDLKRILEIDLKKIKNIHKNIHIDICVIPRAKADNHYLDSQKLFKQTVLDVADNLGGLTNGGNHIIRKINTRTTHMNKSGYGGDGDMPYIGITKETCEISNNVRGKNILLVDDIYTKGVNIDEDAIQALLDSGANNVIFYAVANTYKNNRALKVLSESLKETYFFIECGDSLDDIIQQRGLTKSTIIRHIVEISKLLGCDAIKSFKPSSEILIKVKEAVRKLGGTDKLKPIFNELEESVSYDEIILSLVFLAGMEIKK